MIDGGRLLERLEPAVRAALKDCGRLSAERGEEAYLVGGSVRDLIIGRDSHDVDVVIVGDGMALAQALARARDGELTRYRTFQTARVDLPHAGRIDVATARSEQYLRPGDLPTVSAGKLEDDLARRDFTMNTLAIALNPGTRGRLIDPYEGAADMQRERIRFLHEQSFADDPTRMLRALRFAVRLGYRLEENTERALQAGVRDQYLDLISGRRVRREVQKLFQEEPVEGPMVLAGRELLAALHPDLTARREVLVRLLDATPAPAHEAAREAELWTLVLATLALGLDPQSRRHLVQRLQLSRRERLPLLDLGAPWGRAKERLADSEMRPGQIAETLDKISAGALWVALAALLSDGDRRAELLRRYLQEWRSDRALLRGDDVIALGCPPDQQVGELLRALRSARLDGEVRTESEERTLARRWLRERSN